MDVRHLVLRETRRAGRGDGRALVDSRPLSDEQRAEVGERDLVSGVRLDRDRPPVRRHGARERDLARDRRAHDLGRAEGDVHAAVLAGRERVVTEGELAQHLALDRPRPGASILRQDERPEGDEEEARHPSGCPIREHDVTVAGARRRSQRNLRSCYRVAR
jgi:hypothetical protein